MMKYTYEHVSSVLGRMHLNNVPSHGKHTMKANGATWGRTS